MADRKRRKAGSSWMLLLSSLGLFFLQPARVGFPPPNLPNRLKAVLDKDYPGWRWADVSEEISQYLIKEKIILHPDIIQGDFDGDGVQDFAVQIIHNEKIVAAFLTRKTGFEKHVLNKDYSDIDFEYLYLHKKGTEGYDFPAMRTFIFALDAIGLISYGKGSQAFIYKNGSFHIIYTGD